MALEKQSTNINFALGLDQKTDPRQIKPGKFVSLVNRVFNKGGRLDKRNGYATLGTSVATPSVTYTNSQIPGTLAAGRNLATYSSELLITDGLNLFSYCSGTNNWVYKGRAELCSVSDTSVYKNQNNNITADSALNSTLGINVFAWEGWTASPFLNGTIVGVQISIIDNTTSQTIGNVYLSSTTSRPKCVSISNKLYVIYFDSNDNKLHAIPITQTGFGIATAIITDINATTPNYDVLVNNSLIYIAYCGTGTTVKVASFDSALASVASVSKAETATNGVGIFPDTSNNVWIPYNNGSATKTFIMNSSLSATVLAPTNVDSGAAASGVQNITGVFDGIKGIIFYDKPGLPILGQGVSTSNIAAFTQPAVNGTVAVGRLFAPALLSIIYIDGGGYYLVTEILDEGLQVYTLKNLGYAGNASPGATIADAAATYQTAGYQNAIVTFNTLTAAGVAGTPATFQRSTSLATKAFLVNSVAHVGMMHDSPLQSTYFLGSLYNTAAPVPNAAIVAKIAESSAGGQLFRSILPGINVISTGIVQSALINNSFNIERTSQNVVKSFTFNGVFSCGIDFTTNEIQTNDLGSNLQIGSGTLLMYDGNNTVEHGFHLYPENFTVTNSNTFDGGIGEGLYGYQVVYEWIDNEGQTHRSSPSTTVSIDVGTGGGKNTLVIPTLRITEKQTATIAIYRTIANGSIYFRIDPMLAAFPINNSVSVDTVTVVDSVGDNNIIGNEQIYTLVEVENIAAPATNLMGEYKNRLIVIPSEDPYTWWFSKQVITGSPVEFSDLFQKNVGTVGGELRGIARLDDKLILFKESSIYYVTGTGPAPNGTNDDFADPQFVTADAGLLDPRSIVVTPVGLMFKSAKGIYLLDRSLQARYIGAAVEDFNAYTVRGAKLIPTQNQVRFILSNGTALVYDYFWTDESGIGQWAVFSNIAATSDVLFGGLHTYTTSAGQVFRESAGAYLDGATGINTSFKTGPLNLAGLQGYERAYFFYFLAQYISSHTLTINIYYDYDATTVAQTLTITPTAGDLEQWRVFLSKQKCQAFQIELIEGASLGAGFYMSGLDLVVGLKKGYTVIPSAKSAS